MIVKLFTHLRNDNPQITHPYSFIVKDENIS